MSRKWKTLILSAAFLLVVSCVTAAILNATPKSLSETTPTPAQARTEAKMRNLSLRPEAFKLGRRLGARFAPKSRQTTITTGTLTIGSSRETVTITRRQADDGESVEVALDGRLLTWRKAEGVRGVPSAPTASERLLAERLVLDSADQFILAQLRGASYQTVGRNVRADVGGSDDYSGPLWDLIRLEEPQADETTRPQSPSRLYYLNVQTGLIDKIVSEFHGVTLEAHLLEWVDQAGEKVPSHIIWKRNEEAVQEFRLTSLAIEPQR